MGTVVPLRVQTPQRTFIVQTATGAWYQIDITLEKPRLLIWKGQHRPKISRYQDMWEEVHIKQITIPDVNGFPICYITKDGCQATTGRIIAKEPINELMHKRPVPWEVGRLATEEKHPG